MGLMRQFTWHLMNLCFIIFISVAIVVPGSSGLSEPPSSPIPSIVAQVPISIHEQGPSLASADPPPGTTTPITVPSFDPTLTPSAQPPNASDTPLAAQPPVAIPQFELPTAEPVEAPPFTSHSPPPKFSHHTSTIPFPPIYETPIRSTPLVVPSHASPQQSVASPPQSSTLPLPANPPTSKPQFPVAETPEGFTIPPSKEAFSYTPLQSPHSSALPLAAKPPGSEPHLPVAEPPEGITLTPPIHATPYAPLVSPLHSSALPLAAKPPDSKPPLAIADPPEGSTLTPPKQPSPSIALGAPPHSLALPLAAKPPDTTPQLPIAEPPQGLTLPPPTEASPDLPLPPPAMPPHPSDMQSPPLSLNASSPLPQSGMPNVSSPLAPPVPPQPFLPKMSPPPQLISPYASPPTSILPSNASHLAPITSPPFPEPPATLPSPALPLPPKILSPPSQFVPPIVPSYPPQIFPPIVSAPPVWIPPILSAPPPKQIPPPASPQTPMVFSNASSPPPLLVPPPYLPLLPTAAAPHASDVLPPTVPSHASSPLPLLVPPHASSPSYVLSAPPPVVLPHISPPSSSIVHEAVPPRASHPFPLLTPPIAPAFPVIPSPTLLAPSPSEPYHSSIPPSPVTKPSIPASTPRSSHRKESWGRAPLPSLASPERSPSSKTLPEGAPPAHQDTPRSHPPSSHQIEAPKQAPLVRSNASEPDTVPSSAHPPSKNPASSRYPSTVPPSDQSPTHKISPYHEPQIGTHSAIAPAPFSFIVSPGSNGSHHSPHHSPAIGSSTTMAPSPSHQEIPEISPAPSPLSKASSGHSEIPFPSPKISPSGSSTRNKKRPLAPPILSLPPPPPNADCGYLTCPEPLTNTPPGSPCGCVSPMQVGMRIGVPLYTFFPLVSELAREVAAGVFMKPSQVRVMGANSTIEEPEKTIVLVDLVPLHGKFDNITAFLTFQRFWHKQVVINKSLFGDYDILYVRYPGLPPSPPMAPADIAVINGMPYSVGDPKNLPLGVDVTKEGHKHKLSGIIIAIICFSASVALLICCFIAWLLVFRHANHDPQSDQIPQALPSLARASEPAGNSTGSGPSSSLSIGSSLATYAGSAKTFTASEIEKATDNLSPSRILGEGGFGLVYSGVLEDETNVAVKVLKRDDQQGGREFLAEVEMLSRLHHRNLVKLIGICTDERLRCLVYELIPNGSVDSHLHGIDKETAPLDWASRLKIALGAARGLAYLHEDSSPRVIHRDFKSSNILLENDFTPKVSDFGLARAAMDEENRHISTRVMGTFGYVAPEYAMTGHLLVKSDVYSYGVVLLELLTGRKPVDMSQPPGQENLVAWARPFLTTKEGLELILDPSLKLDVPLDSVAKVAAIASMCVQPEVSHRPFMGEVVQALKLVCNECDDSNDSNSRKGSRESLSIDFDAKGSPISEKQYPLPSHFSFQNYTPELDIEKGTSVSEIFGASSRTNGQESESFRRHSASGPLKTGKDRRFWQRIRRQPNGGSVSEHGIMYRLWAGSH
ncbi:uncharacterized protein LOC130824424 isoform X1 [Amaranthus tricolor]|uniref:uncharacterized protein LOC130824424 isoform X1 n=1 Tax=Amaranthus tricolor TaxID=29722 RepID=UPI00258CD77A|nr:uncharacterized protein LOC130824424 isoform X1 [Amaranthus tricolor]